MSQLGYGAVGGCLMQKPFGLEEPFAPVFWKGVGVSIEEDELPL